MEVPDLLVSMGARNAVFLFSIRQFYIFHLELCLELGLEFWLAKKLFPLRPHKPHFGAVNVVHSTSAAGSRPLLIFCVWKTSWLAHHRNNWHRAHPERTLL